VPDINALEPEMEALSDDALRAKTAEFRSASTTARTSTTC
jgi:preprotein translocase subunit SecA